MVKSTSISLIFAFVTETLCSKDLLFQLMSLLFPENSIFMFYRSKSSQRLISHDIHSNVYNYKSTFSVEIVPICKVASLCFIFRVLWEELGFGDGGHIVGFVGWGGIYMGNAEVTGARKKKYKV